MRTPAEIGRIARHQQSLRYPVGPPRPPAPSARLLLFGLVSCLSGFRYFINPNAVLPNGPGTPSQSGSVTISPTSVALSPGQKVQFTATAARGGTIEWLVKGVWGGKAGAGQGA